MWQQCSETAWEGSLSLRLPGKAWQCLGIPDRGLGRLCRALGRLDWAWKGPAGPWEGPTESRRARQSLGGDNVPIWREGKRKKEKGNGKRKRRRRWLGFWMLWYHVEKQNSRKHNLLERDHLNLYREYKRVLGYVQCKPNNPINLLSKLTYFPSKWLVIEFKWEGFDFKHFSFVQNLPVWQKIDISHYWGELQNIPSNFQVCCRLSIYNS